MNMSKTTILLLSLASAAVATGDDKGLPLFSDNFDAEGTFAEQWVSKKALPKDGKVRVSDMGYLSMRGATPLEFIAEADVTVTPGWSTIPPTKPYLARGGFSCGGHYFAVQPCGKAFMVWKPKEQKKMDGRYPDIPGLGPGQVAHLKLMRKKAGGGTVKYAFWINGVAVYDFIDAEPAKTVRADGQEGYPAISFMAYKTDVEVDNFALFAVSHDDDSPNMVFNSGFEYDEDGTPTHYGFMGSFNYVNWPWQKFRTDYLKRYQVDTAEKHSGKQSLKVIVNGASAGSIQIRPWRTGTVKDAAGVFSVWMKASKEGVKVNLNCDPEWQDKPGVGMKTVEVGREWARYEVTQPKLKGKGLYSPLFITIPKAAQYDALLWLDDLQFEIVPLPEGGVFDAAKAYATVYKPCEADKDRFGTKPESSSPAPQTVKKAAAAQDEVLGRLDFYMNEEFAQWRVKGADGKTLVVKKPLAEIPMGTNVVSFTANGKTYSDTVVKLPYKKGATQVNRWTRSIVHDGRNEVFTGIGIGVAGYFGYKKDHNPFPAMFDMLKAEGFRHFLYMSGSRSGRMAESRAILEESAKRGFLCAFWGDYNIWNYNDKLEFEKLKAIDDVPIEKTIALTKDFDHIVTHIVIDEPELYKKSEWTRAWLEKIKPFYPYAPVQMNNTLMGVPGKYADLKTDILMLDDYLSNNEGRTVDSVVKHADEMMAVPGGKPCWYFLSGDVMSLHYKNLSYAEQIAQSWGCLCAGCTGLSWYFDIPRTEGSYLAMVDVNREAQALAPVILSEELCESATANQPTTKLRHMTRTLEGAWYVLTCNIDARPLSATYTLPKAAPQNGTVEVLYENRTIPLKDGTFKDDYPACFRHLYKIR